MAKILIVEDNDLNLDMLTRRLTRAGHEVVSATNGLDGVEAARSERPDLVLMDISLPEIDGWEATRRLRADPTLATLRVMALTAHAMAEDKQRCFEAGCDDVDTKPVDFQRLLGKIDALLSRERP